MAEIGALSYCGYQQVDLALWIGTFENVGSRRGTTASYPPVKLTSLADYIESIGGPRTSTTDLQRHLERSASTFRSSDPGVRRETAGPRTSGSGRTASRRRSRRVLLG